MCSDISIIDNVNFLRTKKFSAYYWERDHMATGYQSYLDVVEILNLLIFQRTRSQIKLWEPWNPEKMFLSIWGKLWNLFIMDGRLRFSQHYLFIYSVAIFLAENKAMLYQTKPSFPASLTCSLCGLIYFCSKTHSPNKFILLFKTA